MFFFERSRAEMLRVLSGCHKDSSQLASVIVSLMSHTEASCRDFTWPLWPFLAIKSLHSDIPSSPALFGQKNLQQPQLVQNPETFSSAIKSEI